MKESRPGLSSSIALVVIVLVIAAAFYIEIPIVSSNFTASTLTSTTASSSSSATSSSAQTGSSGTLTINTPQPLIVAPNAGETVTLKMTAIGTVSGNYTFSATGLPSGVKASFTPGSVSLPGQLQNPVTLTLSAASGSTVVNATVNVVATAGSSVYTQPFTLMSVQTLVLIQGNAFNPSSLTVAAGSKVYWLNLDPSTSPDFGPDMHDITALDHSFSSGTGSLGQFAVYGHTFATSGTVQYESAAQPAMTGQIVVTG